MYFQFSDTQSVSPDKKKTVRTLLFFVCVARTDYKKKCLPQRCLVLSATVNIPPLLAKKMWSTEKTETAPSFVRLFCSLFE